MTETTETEVLLTPKEAAEFLGTTPAVLSVWRHTKPDKVPFIKRGSWVFYTMADLERVKPTLKRGYGGKRGGRKEAGRG